MFARQEVNTARQEYLDIAKAFAIVFMIHLHLITYTLIGAETRYPTFFLITNWFTGGVFAAPVFMFCMGIGMQYSRGNTPGLLAKRGLRLYLKSWILNIVRAGLIWFLLWVFTQKPEALQKAIFFTTFIDILQFAALAFLLTALLRFLKLNDYAILGVGAALSLVGTFVRNVDGGSDLVNFILGHFVGAVGGNFKTIFPLCNWYVIVAAGRVFGQVLRRCHDRIKFMGILLPSSLLIVLVYNLVCLPGRTGIYADLVSYYYMTLPTAAYALAAVILAISLSYFVTPLLPGRVRGLCIFMSRNINEIYCFHWIIILNLFDFVLIQMLGIQLNLVTLHLAAVLVTAASVLLAKGGKNSPAGLLRRL